MSNFDMDSDPCTEMSAEYSYILISESDNLGSYPSICERKMATLMMMVMNLLQFTEKTHHHS